MLMLGRFGNIRAKGGVQDTGWRDMGTFVSDGSLPVTGGDIHWTNPGNAASDDANFAVCQLAFGQDLSFALKGTNMQGAAVPGGATILGIQGRFNGSQVGSLRIGVVREAHIVKGGTNGATDVSTGESWPLEVTDPHVVLPVGDETNLWGETWTPAEINASGFGWLHWVLDSSLRDTIYNCGHMQIKVFYTT